MNETTTGRSSDRSLIRDLYPRLPTVPYVISPGCIPFFGCFTGYSDLGSVQQRSQPKRVPDLLCKRRPSRVLAVSKNQWTPYSESESR